MVFAIANGQVVADTVSQTTQERSIDVNEHFSPSPSITLGEAIQQLRASDKGDMSNQISAEISQALEQHDAVHVLFNCGTTIQDEIAAHIWMVFATTVKFSEMHRAVANQEHRHVLSGIGLLKLIGIWFLSLPRIISIIFKSLQMKQRLAVEELSQLKQQSIIDIRQAHGIIL